MDENLHLKNNYCHKKNYFKQFQKTNIKKCKFELIKN